MINVDKLNLIECPKCKCNLFGVEVYRYRGNRIKLLCVNCAQVGKVKPKTKIVFRCSGG